MTVVIFTACVYPQAQVNKANTANKANIAYAVDTNRTSSQCKPTEVVIGKYTTRLTADKNRNHNIALACKAINGRVVYPGKIFSFNETVGPRTKKKGYKPATIFVNGRKTTGTGGGVCQVSSTLYNAVLRAKLTVVERRRHSLPVKYVPAGKDAAVSYGKADFKFKNNRQNPIKIYAKVEGRWVKVTITEINCRPKERSD